MVKLVILLNWCCKVPYISGWVGDIDKFTVSVLLRGSASSNLIPKYTSTDSIVTFLVVKITNNRF